jgi:uncharacterized protein
MFERKIYKDLLKWKEEAQGEKALLIEGARRIGKSTVAEEFGRKEYKSCIVIDFNDASDVIRNAFENYLGDLDTFFLILSTEYGTPLYKRDSLIVFDEIQRFPKARQSIKRLVKDGRYDYLETGSLISIRENVKDISLPSEERRIKMHPMDFEEFCLALNEKPMVDYIKRCFAERKGLEENLHHKALMLYKQYVLVGGMPKVVDRYLSSNRSFAAADREKRDILSLYRADIQKIKRKYRAKVLSIFDQIPSFLSKHEKRVRLSSIEPGSTFPSYEDTFFWLGDSMIVNECFACRDPNVGLSLNEDRAALKCYMGDTGLLISHAFDENAITSEELYKQILHGKLGINEGMIFENAIAQALVMNGHRLFFYTHYDETKKRNDIEIDFLISSNVASPRRLCPIEVKSGDKYSTSSLDSFITKYRGRIAEAYIIHKKNLMRKGDILCIPSYMAMCL